MLSRSLPTVILIGLTGEVHDLDLVSGHNLGSEGHD